MVCGHSRGACALRKRVSEGTAATAAERTSSTFFTVVGVVALAVAVGVALPAEAKKRGRQKPVEEAIADPANGEPMTLVVSLGKQKVDVYRGTTLITSSKRLDRNARLRHQGGRVQHSREAAGIHHSNLYSGAPMPWMNRITWSGTALHAGVVPGYPASHGCIRLPFSFAPKLFKITTVGDNVIVARDRLAPQLIEHADLFQPCRRLPRRCWSSRTAPEASVAATRPRRLRRPGRSPSRHARQGRSVGLHHRRPLVARGRGRRAGRLLPLSRPTTRRRSRIRMSMPSIRSPGARTAHDETEDRRRKRAGMRSTRTIGHRADRSVSAAALDRPVVKRRARTRPRPRRARHRRRPDAAPLRAVAERHAARLRPQTPAVSAEPAEPASARPRPPQPNRRA